MKKSKLLNLIFAAKAFLKNFTRNSYIQKNERYNRILSEEFRRNKLLNKIFKIIFSNYRKLKETRKLLKK
jgi:hypothetical protein